MIGDTDERYNSFKRKSLDEILSSPSSTHDSLHFFSPSNNNLQGEAPSTTEEDSAKKAKTSESSPKVLAFKAGHDRFARLELLPTHTLYDLVAILCKYTPIGYNGTDGPNSHMWNITYRGVMYEAGGYACLSRLSAEDTKLESLALTDNSSSVIKETENQKMFPRNNPKSDMPALYVKYVPESNGDALNLDTLFPNLQTWIFDQELSNVNFFQAGKKRHYGFMEKDDYGCKSMMYLPVMPNTLDYWLDCFEQGSKVKPQSIDGCLSYNWQSVVPLPRSQMTEKLQNKYRSKESGFIDAVTVSDKNRDTVMKAFPKIAALAGLKKDKKVPKGWISFDKHYKKCNLGIYTGNVKEIKRNSPVGTAWDGEGQYEPIDKPLFQISGGNANQITGLHDLFCVVEGFLRTL